jgi:hypothetical protein
LAILCRGANDAMMQRIAVLASLLAILACGGTAPDPRYPARDEGCAVKIFHDAPTVPTDNLGQVNATCGQDISDADCIQTMKDQACKMGGDVIWGVPEDTTTGADGKKHISGRAAHTKANK